MVISFTSPNVFKTVNASLHTSLNLLQWWNLFKLVNLLSIRRLILKYTLVFYIILIVHVK